MSRAAPSKAERKANEAARVNFTKGLLINDVTQFRAIFDLIFPLSCVLSLRPMYCCHKIIDPLPPKTVTSFMDDPRAFGGKGKCASMSNSPSLS